MPYRFRMTTQIIRAHRSCRSGRTYGRRADRSALLFPRKNHTPETALVNVGYNLYRRFLRFGCNRLWRQSLHAVQECQDQITAIVHTDLFECPAQVGIHALDGNAHRDADVRSMIGVEQPLHRFQLAWRQTIPLSRPRPLTLRKRLPAGWDSHLSRIASGLADFERADRGMSNPPALAARGPPDLHNPSHRP